MRGTISFFLFTAGLAAQQASLEGVAVNALTGEPLSAVHVKLVTGVMTGVTAAYGAMSDRTGRFSIATVRPGTYVLFCERSGYLQVQAKDAGILNVTLKPGQQLKDYKIAMTPRAILSGTVVDENGDPVQGVSLAAVALPPENVSLMSMMPRGAYSDDRGEFRLAAPPGKYHLKATIQAGPANQFPERRNDGSIAPPYAATFYPSTAVKSRATVVEAVGGKETGGLQVRMTRQQGLSISGIVSGVPNEGGRTNIRLWERRDSSGKISQRGGTVPALDGKFYFTGLEPGTYRVDATFQSSKTLLASRTSEVQLDSSDPPPLTLFLQPLADVSGTLIIEGDTTGTAAERRTIRFDAADGLSRGGKSGETDGQNGFQVVGVSPGVILAEETLEQGYSQLDTSKEDGSYSLGYVAPGKYKIFVIDESEMNQVSANLEQFEDIAEKIELRDRETVTKDLKRK